MILKYCYIFILITIVICEIDNLKDEKLAKTGRRFPSSVSIYIDCVSNTHKINKYICGASILNQVTLLTAANCFEYCDAVKSFVAKIGNENSRKGLENGKKKIYVHEHFDSEFMVFDIALVELKYKLNLGSNVQRVALMRNPPYYSRPARLAGWGYLDKYKQKRSTVITYIYQTVMKSENCSKVLKDAPYGTICARLNYSEKFYTDPGSALIVRDYIQIGLLSYRAERNVLVYTDLGYYYNWIKRYSELLYCNKLTTI